MADVKIEGFTLTAYADGIDRELEAMFGKAVCAYANWQAHLNLTDPTDNQKMAAVAFKSEYEATIRCLDMFVGVGVYFLQRMVAEAAAEEFDL